VHFTESEWSVHESRWDLDLDTALWFREYLSIKTLRPAHMPGDLIPPQSVRSGQPPSPEFQEGWEAWWAGLTLSSPSSEPGGKTGYARDEYMALERWPRLRDTVLGSLPIADRWHRERKSTALNDWRPDLLLLETVKAVEESLGQKLAPFRIDILLLPIQTTEICEVIPGRFMLSEPQRETFLRSDRFRAAIRTFGAN
jgi:hypothetical protein